MNIKEFDLYTAEQWAADGSLNVKEGQVITPDVFWRLCEALPPHRWSGGIFQPGEPYTHEPDPNNPGYMRPLYETFEAIGDDYYKYIGLRP